LDTVERELNLWGYDEIKLPSLEFKGLFETAFGTEITDGFTTWECENGNLLMLRYDFTPQILRFVLHRKEERYPLRIYYKGETFKKSRELWEEIGVGFELVGTESPEADAEVVAVIKTVLDNLGINDYKILVSHRKVWNGLCDKFGEETLKEKRFSPQLAGFLKTYPIDTGDFSEVLPAEAVEDLKRLSELLKGYGLNDGKTLFAPSLEPERDYYSGIFFKVITPLGTVARGGRYDGLLERFGRRIPATGGGIKINKLLELYKPAEGGIEGYYIIDTTPDKVAGWKLARLLRKKGIRAERDIVNREIERSVKVAREKGYTKVVVISEKPVKGVINIPPNAVDGEGIRLLEELFKERFEGREKN
jgi:ATP phosphoribosyltransferase regulatory subunit